MSVRIINADVLAGLAQLPDDSVHCVVTSPPYWNLRDYGTGQWEGGDAECEHKGAPRQSASSTLLGNGHGGDKQLSPSLQAQSGPQGQECSRCGARRVDNQIGLEPTLAEHIERLVAVFEQVRRVLRPDGVLFLNYGDCYAIGDRSSYEAARNKGNGATNNLARPPTPIGLKPKDLCLIPHRLAIALQDAGWWVRSDIIWAKPNPMPESVTDRPTNSHEHVFLLTKNGADPTFWTHERGKGGSRTRPEPDYIWRHTSGEESTEPRTGQGWTRRNLWRCSAYWWDAEAVREPWADERAGRPGGKQDRKGPEVRGHPNSNQSTPPGTWIPPDHQVGRNLRNVWKIPSYPFSEAHFACVDAETECLTAEGWMRQDEIKPGMLAAQFDLDDQRLSWAPIEDVARYDVADQDMIVGKCRDMSMWLTPNHRTIIQRRHHKTREMQAPTIVRADGLKSSHSIPTTADWDFRGDASLALEWAELLGWYISEGHESKDSLSVEIYQNRSANPSECERIEQLLRQVGAEWTKATCPRMWRGRQTEAVAYRVLGYAAVRLRELAPGKLIPWASVLWSDDRIEALLAGLIGGDGHVRQDGRSCYVQKNREQCGLVQALAMRLGMSAVVSGRDDHVYVTYLTKHKTRSFRGTNGSGSPPDVRKYTGTVWCPKLPKGTWVARRNGRPFITGNTFPPKLVETCLKAGCPERVCADCGAPYVREVEREFEKLSGSCRKEQPDKASAADGNDWSGYPRGQTHVKTLGFSPSCDCPIVHPIPAGTVLDPFGGSGTTGLVADRMNCNAILIELNRKYADMARRRIEADSSLFARVTIEIQARANRVQGHARNAPND